MDPVFVTEKMDAKSASSKYQIEALRMLDQIKNSIVDTGQGEFALQLFLILN